MRALHLKTLATGSKGHHWDTDITLICVQSKADWPSSIEQFCSKPQNQPKPSSVRAW